MMWMFYLIKKPGIAVFVLMILLFTSNIKAQGDLLSRRISISIEKETLEKALNKIALSSDIQFSYNSDIINGNQKVSITAYNKRLDKLLTELLGTDYYFRSSGVYVIILKRRETEHNTETSAHFTVKGRVLDIQSGEPLVNATIYDMTGMQSGLSNNKGEFIVKIKVKTTTVALRCIKAEYSDTVVLLNPERDVMLDFKLKHKSIPISTLTTIPVNTISGPESNPAILIRPFIPEVFIINSYNVFIPEKRPAQISVIPTIGTNLKMSGSVVNNFSVNILGGYSRGVSGFEAAGGFNYTLDYVRGFQLAGLANIGGDTVHDFQVAGGVNLCRKDFKGLQIAGLANIAYGKGRGSQIGGVLNYAPSPAFQLGAINIADTNTGIPLGVINIIKGGYYAVSGSTDDLSFYHLLFQMGTHRLYNMAGICVQTTADSINRGLCYGFGSRLLYWKRLELSAELLSTVMSTSRIFDENTITRINLSPKFCIRLFKGMRLAAGPSANVFIAMANNPLVAHYIDSVTPADRKKYSSTYTRFDTWMGWNASLSFAF